jgi:hypothetical protein
LGIGQLANLGKIGNLYNIIVILDRKFHNVGEEQNSETGKAKYKREGEENWGRGGWN